jgi:hypothetical protein
MLLSRADRRTGIVKWFFGERDWVSWMMLRTENEVDCGRWGGVSETQAKAKRRCK